jgi:hypothetical protein
MAEMSLKPEETEIISDSPADHEKGVSSRRTRVFRPRLLSFLSVLLALGLAFEAGLLFREAKEDAPPLVIHVPDTPRAPLEKPQGSASEKAGPGASLEAVSAGTASCAFVGSRNSDLYHLPSCASAKRIKPENLRCFSSEQEALAAGYKPGCLK